MPACTFFGHRDCPPCVREMLQAALVTLIAQYGVDFFYIGCQGKFDAMARTLLRRLCAEYPHIGYAVVLPMLPRGRAGNGCLDFSDTIFPEALAGVPPRFSIARRNDWMLVHAEYVVSYVAHDFGGAAQYMQKAIRQGKTVVNLSVSCGAPAAASWHFPPNSPENAQKND